MLEHWMKVLCSWKNRQHQNLKTSSKVSCRYNNDLWHTHPIPWLIVNPLTPNDLYIRRAVSLLNSRMTYIYVVNSVSEFGGILFTPIRLTAVAYYASGPMKVRLFFRSQNVPPPRPKPLHKDWYICRHLGTAHFSQLTNTVVTLCALIMLALGFTVSWNINTGLLRRTLVDQKGCQWHTVPI